MSDCNGTPGSADLHHQLGAFLTAQLPGASDLAVSQPLALGGGSSKINWAFDASWTSNGQRTRAELLLRQEPKAGVVEASLRHEFAVLSRLAGTRLPVPAALWTDLEPKYFDRPSLIAERMPGRAHRAVLRDKDPLHLGAEGRLALFDALAELLAAVHTIEPGNVLPPPDAAAATTELRRWEHELDSRHLDDGRLTPVRTWLADRIPAEQAATCLVHGDFRPANVLIASGTISALLDWELARIGDPGDDLGWYTCSIYRGEHLPEGRSIDDFVDRYVAAGGVRIDPLHLQFWQVMSVFRLAVIALRGARNVRDGLAVGPPPPAERVVAQALADIAPGSF